MEEHSHPTIRKDSEAKNDTVVRREFLKKVGKATATLPAVTLLLAASAKPASAQDLYNGGSGSGSGSS